MTVLFRSPNFGLHVPAQPHVCRTDGGHLMIVPQQRVADRTQLSPDLAIELMKLSLLAGEAMTRALTERGIPVGRINYQDNGNWGVFHPEGPHLHLHLYGRATNAVHQPYGQALHFPLPDSGVYDHLQGLDPGDQRAVQRALDQLLQRPKYAASWSNSW